MVNLNLGFNLGITLDYPLAVLLLKIELYHRVDGVIATIHLSHVSVQGITSLLDAIRLMDVSTDVQRRVHLLHSLGHGLRPNVRVAREENLIEDSFWWSMRDYDVGPGRDSRYLVTEVGRHPSLVVGQVIPLLTVLYLSREGPSG
jgi:hypothetical protein